MIFFQHQGTSYTLARMARQLSCLRSMRSARVNSQLPTPTPEIERAVDRLRSALVDLGAVVSGIAPEHVGPRRDAASARRQFEKCTAGAPIRGGADSPPARGSTRRPN